MSISATTFTVGGIVYNTTSSNAVEVTSNSTEYSGSITIPATVSYSGITYKVTSIANNAFRYCWGLTSVTIPNSVTSIGDGAFYGCWGLTSVTIPNSVTSIGDGAFSDCTGLTSITIPNSVTSIGLIPFQSCTGLTSITVGASNNYYSSAGGVLFNKNKTSLICYPRGVKGNYTIPSSVTSIGQYAFSSCRGLTSIIIPNSVTVIGAGAFYGCSGLTSVTIPNSVTSIGQLAFSSCLGLTSITIPNSVTSIESQAFSSCSGLISVIIGNSVTSIGDSPFEYCSGLTSITVDASNNYYSSVGGILFNKNKTGLICYPGGVNGNYTIPNLVTSIGRYAFSSCSGLTSITIPNSVTSIEAGAFSGCSGLTSVTIPNSVDSIGGIAFSGCEGLTSITIPNSITSIGDGVFFYCSGLTSITIPNSVTSIGGIAFYYCTGLQKIVATSITPPTVYSGCFDNVDKSIPLYVPAASVSLYASATGWKDFNNIKAMSTGLIIPADPNYSVRVINKNIEISNTIGKSIAVFNISGQKIFATSSAQNTEQLTVTNQGVYIIVTKHAKKETR